MKTIDLSDLELLEVWSKADPAERVSFTFAVDAASGASGASVAYAELAPGGAIPAHFDSANEVVLVLDGTVEVEFDGGTKSVDPGTLVQIDGGSRHRVGNSGDRVARLLLFFDEAADTVTFDEPLMPFDLTVFGGPA